MNVLEAPAGSPWWLHALAAAVLYLHIGGGTVGLASGGAALVFRKGSRPHRCAGHVFFVSMLVMAAIGAVVAPMLPSDQGDPAWFDSLGGVFAFYLVATGWVTVRRRARTAGRFEVAAAVFAAAAAAGAVGLGMAAANSAAGSLGGYAPSGYLVFGGLFAMAAALDLKVFLRGGVAGVPRVSRHIWRMCAGLFMAAGAFFFGQQQVFPVALQGSPLLAVPPFAVLIAMVFWLLKVRLAPVLARFRARRRAARAARAAAEASAGPAVEAPRG